MNRYSSPSLTLFLVTSLVAGCGGPAMTDGDQSPASPAATAPANDGKNAPGPNGAGGSAPATSAGTAGAPVGATNGTTPPPSPALTDTDHDGVTDDRDLCPNTAAGQAVNAAGCDLSSDPAAQIKWGQPLPATPAKALPVTGAVEANGFMSFVIDASGRFPMVFHALASQVEKLADGFHVSGALVLDVPGGTVTVVDADVSFAYGSSAGDGLVSVNGHARVAFPDLGLPSSLQLDAPIAEFGIDTGANLASLNAPLTADRRYLYFRFSDQLGAKIGALNVSVPGGTEHVLVLDPTDPMFYVRADLSGLPEIGDYLHDVGIAFSRQGLLPFTPTRTWGLNGTNIGFSGQMWLETSGGVTLPGLPITLTGDANNVLDIDPDRSGHTVFTDPAEGLRLGVNRSIGIELELIPSVAALDFDMGDASIAISWTQSQKTAALSGIMYPGKSFFNDVVPILPSAALQAAGVIASPLSDSRFAMQGDVSLALSHLNTYTGLSLNDVPLASASMTIDKNGVAIHGAPQTSWLSGVGIGAHASFDAQFPGPVSSAWHADLNGDLSVSGVQLGASTTMHLDQSGIAVKGLISTALSRVTVQGSIDRNGTNLSGSSTVTIPIVAGHDEIQSVLCGYQTVQDGALCGYETVAGFAECGVSYFTECIINHNCGVPTCNGAANSCQDLSKPITCPQTVTVPDFTYGKFSGTVHLAVGTSGLSGRLDGSYCPTSGSCVTIPSGTVDVSSSHACVQVPGLPQTFCTSF